LDSTYRGGDLQGGKTIGYPTRRSYALDAHVSFASHAGEDVAWDDWFGWIFARPV
jgi:hypothetical protein